MRNRKLVEVKGLAETFSVPSSPCALTNNAEQLGESTKHTQTYRLSGAPHTPGPALGPQQILGLIEHFLAIPFPQDLLLNGISITDVVCIKERQ